jgi:Arabinose efflux permease
MPCGLRRRVGEKPVMKDGGIPADATAVPVRTQAALLIVVLGCIYSVSQFLRNSIGVIAPNLAADLGLTATDLGLLSSGFFLTFVGGADPCRHLHRPLRAAPGDAGMRGGSGGGVLLFALARDAAMLVGARLLLGIGCSSFFMAPLAIYARLFPPERFAFLTGIQLSLGNLGTLAATAPLAFAAESVGWRTSFLVVAAFATAAGLAVFFGVRGPAFSAWGGRESWRSALGGVREAMRVRSFWPLFVMHATGYASFGTVVGLWAGPFLRDVYGFDLEQRGVALFAASATQICALFLWGGADRVFHAYKPAVILGASATIACLAYAALMPLGPVAAVVWLVVFGASVAYTPPVMAHGKSLFPQNLIGRGMTLMNIGTMGGVFVMQTVTGRLMDMFGRDPLGQYPQVAYKAVFSLLALAIAAALITYVFAHDAHQGRVREPGGTKK